MFVVFFAWKYRNESITQMYMCIPLLQCASIQFNEKGQMMDLSLSKWIFAGHNETTPRKKIIKAPQSISDTPQVLQLNYQSIQEYPPSKEPKPSIIKMIPHTDRCKHVRAQGWGEKEIHRMHQLSKWTNGHQSDKFSSQL